MSKNDIYDIFGRVKNHIAIEDIALSPVGNILVNYFTLFLKELYDFSDELNETDGSNLRCVLKNNEKLPLNVIKVSTPEEQKYQTLYEQVQNTKANPQFKTNTEALKYFIKEYHNLGGDDFWMEAEDSTILTEDHRKIMRLSRAIQMCKHLIGKGND